MLAAADVVHPSFEVVTINGKSYPYTEPLEYTAGDNIRWRVINPSFSEHPMHLHGAFYEMLSLGNFETDTAYADGDRQSVVTQNLQPGNTMMLQWTPGHAGRWLFHCHFHLPTSACRCSTGRWRNTMTKPKAQLQLPHTMTRWTL